ncbi:HTTM domain-containing protein [Streptomyces sp. NRRL S-4]|uniref:HTTM domain-containing protein n=1 Tax=Streptomyces sp. NRRL S-4 TaxID=1519471 RepID=UPI0006CDDE0E|nr:HTTM domain-containing protein [Streptomyces sp. NRRL S-4]KPC82510.1 deoxyribonuclease HsdR [Streptomyces sp. NRRL S-4]
MRWLSERADAFWTLVTGRPVSLYAAAVLRIGYGLLYLAFLLREFPHRNEIWGPGSPWTHGLAQQLFEQSGWNSILTLSGSRTYFELCYAAALVTSLLFTLGWRTRIMSILFAVVVVSFHARAIFMTDGGDNLILLMALYLVLTACGRRWSLDARRTRRAIARAGTAPPRPRKSFWLRQLNDVRVTLTTVVHNCGLFVIAAQVCLLYGAAGLYKVQGASWGGGTAIHYVLNLDLFQPWPALSHLVDQYPTVIAVASYVTVLLQVAFPFVLFGRLKYPVLAMLLGMHIGIAFLMGLPLFSGAMIVADAAFLPDRFYIFLARSARHTAARAGLRRHSPSEGPDSRSVPPQLRGGLSTAGQQIASGGGRPASADKDKLVPDPR